MRTRVKICGITNWQDAEWASFCGADALGFVFYDKSPRAISGRVAADIGLKMPALVSKVGLFVNSDQQQVEQTLTQCPLDVLQFHGDESPLFCEQFKLPYLKAIRVKGPDCITQALSSFAGAAGLLLDTYQKGVPGGTGKTFNWDWIEAAKPNDGFNVPIILAGGLNPDNVVAAIKQCKPYGVDVSGGVEASKGVKDPQKVAGFIQGVNSVKH